MNPEVLATFVGLLAMIVFTLVCYVIRAIRERGQ